MGTRTKKLEREVETLQEEIVELRTALLHLQLAIIDMKPLKNGIGKDLG